MECLACVCTVRVFAGETNPASTVSTARSEVRFVPRVVALSVLTLFRRRRCWAKPNHAFSHCQQLRSFFFQAGRRGVTAVAGPDDASNDDDDDRCSSASSTCFSQTAFFKGFAKMHRRSGIFDDVFASMRRGRDGHPESRFEAPEKNLRRRPRFASHKPDLRESARTPTRCRRRFDDHPTRSRTSHRACRRRPSRCSRCTSTRHPHRTRRTRRRGSTRARNVSFVASRGSTDTLDPVLSRLRAMGCSPDRHFLQRASRAAKTKPAARGGRSEIACFPRAAGMRRSISGLLLPAARRSRPERAAR